MYFCFGKSKKKVGETLGDGMKPDGSGNQAQKKSFWLGDGHLG